jgi:hypothetical protein
MDMTNGSADFHKDPRVADNQKDDDTGFNRMMQLAAAATMMDNRTALGFGLGSLLANYLARARARTVDTKLAQGGFNAPSYNLPAYQDFLNKYGGATPQANYGPASYNLPAYQNFLNTNPNSFAAPSSAEIQNAAAAVANNVNQNAGNQAYNLLNNVGYQNQPYQLADTDWRKNNQ